jgi:hypothetical protein
MLKTTDRFIKYKVDGSEDINKYASEDILNLSMYHYTVGWDRSNQGGWQAHYLDIDNLEWMYVLNSTVESCAREILEYNNPRSEFDLNIYYWLNINYYNTNNNPHHHSKATYKPSIDPEDEMRLIDKAYAPEVLSGSYYVKVPENSGDFYIREKRYSYLNTIFNTNFDTKLDVQEGELVLFWPDVMHGVESNLNKEEPRISIAFNIGIKPKDYKLKYIRNGYDCVNE